MSQGTTLADLFEQAIAAEELAAQFYVGLTRKFAQHPEAANFWSRFAAEEKMHSLWLARFRDALEPERLAETADPAMLQAVKAATSYPIPKLLAAVQNMEDAFQIVVELENAETNVVFDFLVANFAMDDKLVPFLRSQISEHVGRLMTDVTDTFGGASQRREIQAMP